MNEANVQLGLVGQGLKPSSGSTSTFLLASGSYTLSENCRYPVHLPPCSGQDEMVMCVLASALNAQTSVSTEFPLVRVFVNSVQSERSVGAAVGGREMLGLGVGRGVGFGVGTPEPL